VEAAVQAAPAAPPEPAPVADLAEVPAPAPVVPVRPRIETPIAFESPRVAEPVVARVEADASIPPVDLDNHFFTMATHPAELADADDHEPHEERDPRMVLKLSPAAARRRAQFQRYVKLAVGAASVLCLAALVKVAVAHNHEEPVVRRASASMQAAPPPIAQPAQVTPVTQRVQPLDEIPPPPPPAETAPAAPAVTAAAVTPTAEPAPAPATAAPDPATDTAAPVDPDPKAAAKEKHASQLALERGKVGEAIEAGERSVALDPSDAEAWLILGAAYQEKGDAANARRSFKSCLSEGKRGPKWECAQFPH